MKLLVILLICATLSLSTSAKAVEVTDDETNELEDIEGELYDLGFNSEDFREIFSELDQVDLSLEDGDLSSEAKTALDHPNNHVRKRRSLRKRFKKWWKKVRKSKAVREAAKKMLIAYINSRLG
eukprot:TRINITY_DN4147_c0_g1_i3.p1 TRINITY_DN4147_c0_g1~~TRINITY_DN4147_c0_g1_i3.p1  ORF type:complete len:124 (-),score=24.72 TRINITY_DN4147_c0_g1_i3:109-480(-)